MTKIFTAFLLGGFTMVAPFGLAPPINALEKVAREMRSSSVHCHSQSRLRYPFISINRPPQLPFSPSTWLNLTKTVWFHSLLLAQ